MFHYSDLKIRHIICNTMHFLSCVLYFSMFVSHGALQPARFFANIFSLSKENIHDEVKDKLLNVEKVRRTNFEILLKIDEDVSFLTKVNTSFNNPFVPLDMIDQSSIRIFRVAGDVRTVLGSQKHLLQYLIFSDAQIQIKDIMSNGSLSPQLKALYQYVDNVFHVIPKIGSSYRVIFQSRIYDIVRLFNQIKLIHRDIALTNPILGRTYKKNNFKIMFSDDYVMSVNGNNNGNYIFVGEYNILADFDDNIHLIRFNEDYSNFISITHGSMDTILFFADLPDVDLIKNKLD